MGSANRLDGNADLTGVSFGGGRAMLEALEPRLLLAADGLVDELEISRGYELEPGSEETIAYFGVVVIGTDLTGLEVTTPWGDVFNTSALPLDWGSDQMHGGMQGNLDWRFDPWPDGTQSLELSWDDLSDAQWALVGTENVGVDAFDASGTVLSGAWAAANGDIPTAPQLLSPSFFEATSATPLIEWSAWGSPPAGGIIEVGVGEAESWWNSEEERFWQWTELATSATQWTPPSAFVDQTFYEAEVEFLNDVEAIDPSGTTILWSAGSAAFSLFTIGTAGIDEVGVFRGIDYDVPNHTGDDQSAYGFWAEGTGFTDGQVTTPWGQTVSVPDLFPAHWEPFDEIEIEDGNLFFEMDFQPDGSVELEVWWEGLSPTEWASLDTGDTSLSITYGDGVVWNATVDFSSVVQHGQEPAPTAPTFRGEAPTDLTVTWPQWNSPPASGVIFAEIWEESPGWTWNRQGYEDDADLAASATQWTPPTLPDHAGAYELIVEFVDMTDQEIGGVTVEIGAYTANEFHFTVGRPAGTLQTDPATGNSYFLTPFTDWDNAQGYAQYFGANLVTVNSAAEETFLRDTYGTDLYWTGLNDRGEEDVWQWADGSPVTYTNWGTDQPDDGFPGQDVVAMNYQQDWPHSDGTQWADLEAGRTLQGIAWLPAGTTAPGLADDHANTPDAATPIAVGDTEAAGLGYAGDIDWYEFNAEAGVTYDITLEVQAGPMDSVLLLLDPTGQTLLEVDGEEGEDDGVLDSFIQWTAPSDGVYLLGADAHIGGFGAYELTLTSDAPTAPALMCDFDGDGRDDLLWRHDGGDNQMWFMNGGAITGSAGFLPVTDMSWHVAAVADFDGDGKGDILWRNTDGTNQIWFMDGPSIRAATNAPPVADASWQVAGAADFDGDGKGDLLWRNTDGTNQMWFMDGAGVRAAANTLAVPDANWQVGGAGDFNGDGKGDLLWRNTDSTNQMWFMDGAAIGGAANAPSVADTGWQVGAVGDFNGDGKGDLLWRHSGGTNQIWHMDGASLLGTTDLPTVPGEWHLPGWRQTAAPAAAVQGDFDGDGYGDILWRHSSGANHLWFMNGGAIREGVDLPSVPDTNWRIVGVGDFDGDGKADILWRHSTGQNHIWFMNGATIRDAADAPLVNDVNWQVAGVGDLNDDGKADMIWHHSSGLNIVWFMDGATITSTTEAPTVADPDWQVAGVGDLNGDGYADVLWRHAIGVNHIWFIGDEGIASEAGAPTVSDANWQVGSVADYDGDGKADLLWRHSSGVNIVWFMDGESILSSTELLTVPAPDWDAI